MTDLKFSWANGNGTIDQDNFLIDPIPTIPTSGAATIVTATSFQANWSTVAGVTGYSLDVSTSPTFSSFVSGYNNLYVAGQATSSLSVTGLSASTQYYYRVRGTSEYSVGSFSSGNSSDQTLTTPGAGTPNLTSTALTAFGAQCINGGPYGPNTFTISGTTLTTADVTVAALSGFEYSATGGAPYFSSLSLTQGGGTYGPVTISVRFNPTLVQDYSGNIVIGGGGASNINRAASGSGVNTPPSVTTGSAFAITATTDSVAGTIDMTGACGSLTAYGIEYNTSSGSPGSGTQVASTNLTGTSFSSALTGLTPCTVYYTHAYATRAAVTTYGAEGTFTTGTVDAPVATAGTSISTSGFTATWGAVTGATGYSLDVSTSATFGTSAPLTTLEEFDNGTTAPAGWTITASSTYTSAGNYGANSPSLKLQNDGEDVTTVTLGAPASDLSFWIKGNGTGASSSLLVEGYNGSTWSTVDNIGPIPTSGTTKSYTSLTGNGFVQFRFTYSKTAGNLALDDVSFTCLCDVTPSFVTGYEDLAVAGTSQVITGLDPATTYYYRVRSEGASCTSVNSNEISVTTNAVPTYYSQASGNVTDNIWSNTTVGTAGPAVWTSGSSMVVQAGNTVTNTADVDLNAVTVDATGTLVLNGSTNFKVHNDADFSGTLTADDLSTLSFIGSAIVTSADTLKLYNLTANVPGDLLTDADFAIRGSLRLVDGDFDVSTGSLTLTSDAVRTGRLGKVGTGATFTGSLTMQRYIPGGSTNWRFLGSPVAGQTIANWQDDFFTAGYPGSAYPNFYDPPGSGIFWPSIRYYDETNNYALADTGIVGVTSNTQALAAGQGFLAWSGDNFTSTTAFTVDVTGTPNIASTPITLPMSYTSSGTNTEDGWNLVSNPLPSAIAFDSISRGADVPDQYWIFNPVTGSHQTYSAGVGAGQVNGKIQSSQAFWLKANGTSVTTSVSEDDKINDLAGGVFGGDQEATRPILRLTVASALNEFSDEAVFVFDQGTPDLDSEDAPKFNFHTFGAPQVASKASNGDPLAINFFGAYITDMSIPVTVDVDVTGTYTISAAMAGMQGLSCISLEDLSTGSNTPLTEGASY
ncbi:MAG: hypothetical protein WAU08_14355, partial [Flavobacteriales bacterium]